MPANEASVKPLLARDIQVTTDGEVMLSLRVRAAGTSWVRAQAEAATISIHVDGRKHADTVLIYLAR